LAAAVVGKQLELLKMVAPNSRDVATIFNPTNVTFQAQQVGAAMAPSEKLGLQLRVIEVRTPSEFEPTFNALVQEKKGALLILIDPLFIANSKTLAELSVKSRLITMTGYRTFAEAGALMSYGPNYFETYKAAAPYVDKILRGKSQRTCPLTSPAGLNLS
jgi:putative ABC transport system substrate-binding protein